MENETHYNNAYGVKVKNDNVEKALEVFNRRVRKCKRMLKWKKNQYYTKPSKERREERKRKEYNAKKQAAEDQWWKAKQHWGNG